jgi:hypothetical protein
MHAPAPSQPDAVQAVALVAQSVLQHFPLPLTPQMLEVHWELLEQSAPGARPPPPVVVPPVAVPPVVVALPPVVVAAPPVVPPLVPEVVPDPPQALARKKPRLTTPMK